MKRLTKKKILSVLLAAVLVSVPAVFLAGCSGSRDDGESVEQSAQSPTELTAESISVEEAENPGEDFVRREGVLDAESMDISDDVGDEISRSVSEMEMAYRSNPSGPVVDVRDWSIYSSQIATQKMSSAEIEFLERLDELCQRYINDAALDGVKNEKYDCYVTDAVQYSDLGLTKDQAVAALGWFLFNNPQYYFARADSLFSSSAAYLRIYSFAADGKERADITNELFNKLDGWIEMVEDNAGTTWQKEVLANNLLCENLTYDHDAVKEENKEALYFCQSLYSAVMTQNTVCTGYAKAFCAMMGALDVDVTMGISTGHAWNVVRFDDGNYYAVDVCWNDTDEQSPAYNNRFLNVGDADSKAWDDSKESHSYRDVYASWIPAIAEDSYSPTEYDTSAVKIRLDAPGNIQVTENSANTICFSWDAVEDADWYQAAVFKDSAGTEVWTDWPRTDTTSGVVSGLKPETTYYYGVRSVKTIDGRDYYSDWTYFSQKTAPEQFYVPE